MNLTLYTQENLKDFNDTEFRINSIFFDISMEEDTTTSVDDKSNKMNFAQKLKGRVEKIINEIIAIVDRFGFKLKNTLTRIAQTDVGFKDSIRKAIKNNKPLEAVKLISYNYNNSFLDNQYNKMSNVCLGILTDLKTSYAKETNDDNPIPLDMDEKSLYKHIFSKVGVPSDVTDLNLYFEFLKKGFRSGKKEQLFVASKRNEYYNIAIGREKFEKTVYEKQKVLKNQTATLKNTLNNIITNPDTQNEIKNRAIKQYSNASHIYNFYTSFLDIYVQLKIEYFLTYRVVLKKLYHI